MLLSKAIKYRIEKLLKENDMTSYSLAMSAGIPPSTLNDFLRGKERKCKKDIDNSEENGYWNRLHFENIYCKY